MIQPLRLAGIVVSVVHLVQPPVATPQTPAGPARVRAEVRSTADSVLLVGDLHLPAGSSGRAPGLVLLGVTGPNDRRLALGRLAPFDSLARRLAEQGIAVLTLDDRGVGESGGDWTRAGHDLLVADGLSAAGVLARHPQVDPSRIGFMGLSEGAGIAMMAAARRPDLVAFLILASPPGLPGEAALRAQLETALGLAGVSGPAADPWRRGFDQLMGLVRAGDSTALEQFLAGPGAQLIPPYGFIPREPAARASLLMGPWYRSQVDYDPAAFLSRVTVPALVIGGAVDPILPPSLHHPPIRTGLGSRDVEFHVLSGLNHLLIPARTGLPTEYPILTQSVDPRVPALIGRWLLRGERNPVPPSQEDQSLVPDGVSPVPDPGDRSPPLPGGNTGLILNPAIATLQGSRA